MPDTRVTVTDVYGDKHTLPGPFRSVSAIKQANREANGHFFSADTMRFFDSRVESGVIAGRLFVTSEQFEDSRGNRPYPREFTVRVCSDHGHVNNLIDTKFPSADAAEQAARAAATEET